MRQVEEDSADARMRLEDSGQQRAGAAPNVDHGTEPGKVVGGDDGGVRGAGHRPEEGVVDRPRPRIAFPILEVGHPEDLVERRLAGAHAVQEPAPGAPAPLPDEEQDGIPHRTGDIGPQGSAERSELDAAAVRLGDDAEGSERTHEPPE